MSLRVSASLYLHGDSLDPSRVSSLLGLVPARARRKGEAEKTASGSVVVARTGVWVSEAASKAATFEEQVAELLRPLQSFERDLQTIKGVDYAYISIFIGVAASDNFEPMVDFALDARVIADMSRLGLMCRITVSVVLEDE